MMLLTCLCYATAVWGKALSQNTAYSVIREACRSLEHLLRAYYNHRHREPVIFISAYFSLSCCLFRSTVGLLVWWEGWPTTLGLDWPISITITQSSEIAALSKWSPISHQNDTLPWPACRNECEKRDRKGKSKAEKSRKILYDER